MTNLPATDEQAFANEKVKALVEALKSADQFISNGIELGYIRMPDPDTTDAATKTPAKVRAALAAIKE